MNEAPPNNRLILSTETPFGIGGRVFALLFFGGLAAFITACVALGRPRPIDGYVVLSVVLLQLLTFGAAVFCILYPPRGTWVFDDDAVAYHPCLRPPRTLPWRSVERVTWRHDIAILKSGPVKISIPWQVFKEAESSHARAFAEAKLSPEFDLKDVVLPHFGARRRDTSHLERLLSMTKLVAIGVALLVPSLTVVLLAVCFASAANRLWSAVEDVFFLNLGLVIACGIVFARMALREPRRIHPEWPWRLPRAKSLELTKAGGDPWFEDL